MDKRHALTLILCAALFGMADWASDQARAQDASAQEKTITKLQNAGSASPDEPVVGPPKPKGKAARPNLSRSRSKVRPNSVPKPTVKLKPGEVPNIEFDMPTYNAGRIRAGADLYHDFWFTNTGTGPLEILRVKPS